MIRTKIAMSAVVTALIGLWAADQPLRLLPSGAAVVGVVLIGVACVPLSRWAGRA